MPGMQLIDAKHRVLAEMRPATPSGQAHGYPQSNMFDQPELERVLRAALAELPGGAVPRRRRRVEIVEVERPGSVAAPVRVRGPVSRRRSGRCRRSGRTRCSAATARTAQPARRRGRDDGGPRLRAAVAGRRRREARSRSDVYDGVQQVCDPTAPRPSCRSARAGTGGSSGCVPARRGRADLDRGPGPRADPAWLAASDARQADLPAPGLLHLPRRWSPIAGATRPAYSCSATPPTRRRRSSDRACAPESATPRT